MGRTGWWYQVSRDIYPETKTSYGQDLYNMNSTVGYFAREVAEVIFTEPKS